MAKGTHDERYQALLQLLRERRQAQGMTQASLAQRLGRPQQFISKYEAGERRLDVIEFLDIARALGMDCSSVLAGFERTRG